MVSRFAPMVMQPRQGGWFMLLFIRILRGVVANGPLSGMLLPWYSNVVHRSFVRIHFFLCELRKKLPRLCCPGTTCLTPLFFLLRPASFPCKSCILLPDCRYVLKGNEAIHLFLPSSKCSLLSITTYSLFS